MQDLEGTGTFLHHHIDQPMLVSKMKFYYRPIMPTMNLMLQMHTIPFVED